MAGVAYDGVDPSTLTCITHTPTRTSDRQLEMGTKTARRRMETTLVLRIKDLVDQTSQTCSTPTDTFLSKSRTEHGRPSFNLSAKAARRTDGSRVHSASRIRPKGTCVLDHERGIIERHLAGAVGNRTCIGNCIT